MERQQGRRIAPMSLSDAYLIDNLKKAEKLQRDKEKAIALERSKEAARESPRGYITGVSKRGVTKKLKVRNKPRGKNATKRARYLKAQKRRSIA